MKTLKIDVWSDIACPWCYVGKRRLEAALADFPHRDAVAVTWHSFELDPSAPAIAPATPGYAERLAAKYGRSVAHAQGMIDNMTKVAAVDGLDMRFDKVRAGNTFDAHRLIHFAADKGVQGAMKERLLRAYMTEGEAIGDREVLARLAAEVGLDAAEVAAVLASDRYADGVRADEQNAREIGITGVPFFAVAERYGVSGAQPAEVLLEVLEKAWEALPDEAATAPVEGAVCGPDGCA
ncbi:MAG: dsbA [Myxococcaceae bacterium]|nr:dsbA [Myxococcaceae bacterium]